MTEIFVAPLLQGFGVGVGLILTIGAQNAFVLRQGLRRLHVLTTASVCSLCDAILIVLGVSGLGEFLSSTPGVTIVATWSGAVFLLLYGLRSFNSANAPATLEEMTTVHHTSLRKTVLTALALSLLNPHVYLDTIFLLGSVGAHYPINERMSFAGGAVLGSVMWFFSLAYCAAWLAPVFKRATAWKVLDICVGCLMWMLAISLIWSMF